MRQQGKVCEKLCFGGVLRGKWGPLAGSSAGLNRPKQEAPRLLPFLTSLVLRFSGPLPEVRSHPPVPLPHPTAGKTGSGVVDKWLLSAGGRGGCKGPPISQTHAQPSRKTEGGQHGNSEHTVHSGCTGTRGGDNPEVSTFQYLLPAPTPHPRLRS